MDRPDTRILVELARLMAAARGISLARLSTIIANGGNYFASLERGQDTGVAKYNRLLDHFADPANWPDHVIPPDAQALIAGKAKADRARAVHHNPGKTMGAAA